MKTFYCLKRFNDFYALYKVVKIYKLIEKLKIKFSLIEWPKFPPKSDLSFNKEEKRKKAFNKLLEKLIEVAIAHLEIK